MSSLVWLITGCSSGFGAEFVRQLLSRGDRVIATARNKDKLQSLEDAGAVTLALDVTSPEATIRDIVSKAIAVYGQVDVLVNNAGYVASGSWEDLRYDPHSLTAKTIFTNTLKAARTSCLRSTRMFSVLFKSPGRCCHISAAIRLASWYSLAHCLDGSVMASPGPTRAPNSRSKVRLLAAWSSTKQY